MAEPQNILTGDNTGVDLPQMQLDDGVLIEEKKMAKYSRTAEFKRIQEIMQQRIDFWQKYLPDGRLVLEGQIPTPEQWVIANTVIAEFQRIINMYETAEEAVKEYYNKNGK